MRIRDLFVILEGLDLYFWDVVGFNTEMCRARTYLQGILVAKFVCRSFWGFMVRF